MKYQVNGKPIRCACCGEGLFRSDKRQLNTKTATFFNADWMNKNAAILTCLNCTHIMWFEIEPSKI